jgi:hypothetical protein
MYLSITKTFTFKSSGLDKGHLKLVDITASRKQANIWSALAKQTSSNL